LYLNLILNLALCELNPPISNAFWPRRLALDARVRCDREPLPEIDGALAIHCGAFVTIHRGGELRGVPGTRVLRHAAGRRWSCISPRPSPIPIPGSRLST
jgi:hypothetical protein